MPQIAFPTLLFLPLLIINMPDLLQFIYIPLSSHHYLAFLIVFSTFRSVILMDAKSSAKPYTLSSESCSSSITCSKESMKISNRIGDIIDPYGTPLSTLMISFPSNDTL